MIEFLTIKCEHTRDSDSLFPHVLAEHGTRTGESSIDSIPRGKPHEWTQRSAFTFVELLVVITIITMLVAITVPALSSAHESTAPPPARTTSDSSGSELPPWPTATAATAAGAFDWQRDGCVTEVGWVADLVGVGTFPGKMLCPSNQVQVSRTYSHLLARQAAAFSPLSNKAGSPEGRQPDGTPKVNVCRRILGAGREVAHCAGPGSPRVGRKADLSSRLQHQLLRKLVAGALRSGPRSERQYI